MGSFLNTDRDGNMYSKDSGSGAMTNELLQGSLTCGTNPHAFDAVDPAYILAVLHPEENMARQQQEQIINTAISHGRTQYSISTNAAGNAAIYVFPN